jgi:hypothetical protein
MLLANGYVCAVPYIPRPDGIFLRAKISLRVPKRDLVRLKSRALQEGIPYQTLINALIHRYVSD